MGSLAPQVTGLQAITAVGFLHLTFILSSYIPVSALTRSLNSNFSSSGFSIKTTIVVQKFGYSRFVDDVFVHFTHAFEVGRVAVHAGSANFRVQSFLAAVEDAVDWGAGQRRSSCRQAGDQGTPPIPTAVRRHPRMHLDQDSE